MTFTVLDLVLASLTNPNEQYEIHVKEIVPMYFIIQIKYYFMNGKGIQNRAAKYRALHKDINKIQKNGERQNLHYKLYRDKKAVKTTQTWAERDSLRQRICRNPIKA